MYHDGFHILTECRLIIKLGEKFILLSKLIAIVDGTDGIGIDPWINCDVSVIPGREFGNFLRVEYVPW